jgi:hypothetical protein
MLGSSYPTKPQQHVARRQHSEIDSLTALLDGVNLHCPKKLRTSREFGHVPCVAASFGTNEVHQGAAAAHQQQMSSDARTPGMAQGDMLQPQEGPCFFGSVLQLPPSDQCLDDAVTPQNNTQTAIVQVEFRKA